MEFSSQEQLDNLDKMIVQYMETVFDLTVKIIDFLEKRKSLIEQLKKE